MYVGITEADARLARFGILGLPPGRVRFPREMPESVIVIAMVLTGPNNSLCAMFLGRSTCVLKPALLVLFSDILLLIRPPKIIYVRRLLSARNRTGGAGPAPRTRYAHACTQTLSTLPSPPFLPWGPCHRTHGRTGYSAVR